MNRTLPHMIPSVALRCSASTGLVQRHVSADFWGIHDLVRSCRVGQNTCLPTQDHRGRSSTNKQIHKTQRERKSERRIHEFCLTHNRGVWVFAVYTGHCSWRFIDTKPSSFSSARVLVNRRKKQNWAVALKVSLGLHTVSVIVCVQFPATYCSP